ncbi:hypothetical protein GCM10012275_38430 [Longimycelium tulufanense]|uniref:Uncharacterized protein n=1 Tax=Longimycelium tulufanense TaxID=907463 RepID=A0A8J3CGU5_9PSEU|nr:hypothetical protein [Longimycelium tulufanense]GGM64193.1 hypothetical protein GCM10012275_38430 [Longimycelium tulufanense]
MNPTDTHDTPPLLVALDGTGAWCAWAGECRTGTFYLLDTPNGDTWVSQQAFDNHCERAWNRGNDVVERVRRIINVPHDLPEAIRG